MVEIFMVQSYYAVAELCVSICLFSITVNFYRHVWSPICRPTFEMVDIPNLDIGIGQLLPFPESPSHWCLSSHNYVRLRLEKDNSTDQCQEVPEENH